MKTKALEFLGQGIYSISEASSLSGIPAANISRWVKGYSRVRNGRRMLHPPVFDSDFEQISGRFSLSFLDLIEILFVEAFVHHGVSLQTIRLAVNAAADSYHFSHPFAKRKFMTDGRTILMQIAHDTDDKQLVNLINRQYEIHTIVSPILKGDLEFGELDVANRWWPMGRNQMVVLDPSRNFGQPVIDKFNIPTATLVRTFANVGSVQGVADWFEIDIEAVESAIQFETIRAAA